MASDDLVPAIPVGTGGVEAHRLWGRDDVARFPDDGSALEVASVFPPPGGCRLPTITLPPGHGREFDEFVVTELAPWADQRFTGMHRTPWLDFDVVLQGDIGLELDGEREVVLHQRYMVVQSGTRHRWHNRGDGPATLLTIVLGAHHDLVPESAKARPTKKAGGRTKKAPHAKAAAS